MAITDWFPSNLRGTLQDTFRLGRPTVATSSQIKNNAGALELRNYLDTAYVNGRGLPAVGANDFVTLSQLGGALAVETGEYLPTPEAPSVDNATRAGQTTLEGASYIARVPLSLGQVGLRVTATAAPGTLKFMIFQGSNGRSGIAARIATISTWAPPGTGNHIIPFAEGTVSIAPGLFYVLWGRDSAAGGVTLQTYTTGNAVLLIGTMIAGTHPTTWTTALASTSTPATFNPLSGTPTTSATAPQIRLIA